MNNASLIWKYTAVILFGFSLIVFLGVSMMHVKKFHHVKTHGELFIFDVKMEGRDPSLSDRNIQFTLLPNEYGKNGEELSFEYGPYENYSRRRLLYYIKLEKNEAGMAQVIGISETKPESGFYLGAKELRRLRERGSNNTIPGYSFRYEIGPFYNKYSRDTGRVIMPKGDQKITARVRILDDIGIIEDIYVDDMPLGEYLAKRYKDLDEYLKKPL